MNISVKSEYALKAIFDLACQTQGEPVKIAEIARRQQIPQKFLELILASLKQGGFVESRRGAEGGYRLARAPEQINVGTVVRGTEEDFALVQCFRDGGPECPIAPACVLSPVLERALGAFFRELDGSTLSDLVRPQAKLVALFGRASPGR